MDEANLVLEFVSYIEVCFSNQMYRAVSAKSSKRKSGYWAVEARTDRLKNYQKSMEDELPKIIDADKLKKFKYAYDTGVYDIQVESVHKVYYKRFYDFDASNLIKAHEDCVAKYIGIDDSRTSKYICEKVPTEVDNGWEVHTTMKLVPRNPLCVRMK